MTTYWVYFFNVKMLHKLVMNSRDWVGNTLLVAQGAHSSVSDASDFTGDKGAGGELFLHPPGELLDSRHRYSEFKPGGENVGFTAVNSLALLSVVFLPDISASTLNGWCRRTAGGDFSSSVSSAEAARWLSSLDELQSWKVSRDAISPTGLNRN